MTNSQDVEYKRAKRRVGQLRHFYSHLASYAVVIVFLHLINLLTSDSYWAYWPMLGWGVAVALHAIRVMEFVPIFDEEWEEKQIQKILAKRSGRAQDPST